MELLNNNIPLDPVVKTIHKKPEPLISNITQEETES